MWEGETFSSQIDYYSLAGHLIGSTNGSTTTYDLTDAQGTVLMSLTSSAIQGEQAYGPYGNQRYTQGTIGTDKGYTGQFHDSFTGLDYYNARYYDPVAGQFLSPDSVQGNAQGMDPYAYVGGNPETSVDPTGNHPCGCGWCGDAPCAPPGKSGNPPTSTQKPGNDPSSYCSSSTYWNGSQCVANIQSCRSGTHQSGNGCVANVDQTQKKNDARNNKLTPIIMLSAGLILAGGALIILSYTYAAKMDIDDDNLPDLLGKIGDTISILSEVASAISFVNPSIAAVAYGLLGIFHGVQAIANGVLSVYNAVMSGFSWLKGIVQTALKAIGIAVEGVPGTVISEFFGKAIVYGTRAAGQALMAEGNAGLVSVAYQKSINIDEWCTQYGQDEAAC